MVNIEYESLSTKRKKISAYIFKIPFAPVFVRPQALSEQVIVVKRVLPTPFTVKRLNE